MQTRIFSITHSLTTIFLQLTNSFSANIDNHKDPRSNASLKYHDDRCILLLFFFDLILFFYIFLSKKVCTHIAINGYLNQSLMFIPGAPCLSMLIMRQCHVSDVERLDMDTMWLINTHIHILLFSSWTREWYNNIELIGIIFVLYSILQYFCFHFYINISLKT